MPAFAVLGLGLWTGNAVAEEIDVDALIAEASPSSHGGTSVAISRQRGNNTATIDQTTTVKSGDSVVNSQVTGVVGSGSVQNTNLSLGDASARSGDVNANVTSTVNVGPSATVSGNGNGGGIAISSQTGSNTARVKQHTLVASGDCVVNSQVSGVVGDADVENTNLALGDGTCVSGDVTATVIATVNIGPSATVPAGPETETLGSDVELLDLDASTTVLGDTDEFGTLAEPDFDASDFDDLIEQILSDLQDEIDRIRDEIEDLIRDIEDDIQNEIDEILEDLAARIEDLREWIDELLDQLLL